MELVPKAADFPQPEDLLPELPMVIRQISLAVKDIPGSFKPRLGGSPGDAMEWIEFENSVINDAVYEQMFGSTYWQGFMRFWKCFWHKERLIETVQAVGAVDSLALLNGRDVGKQLKDQRSTYLRQCFSKRTDVHNTVSMKLAQLLFFHALFLRGRVPTWLRRPPPANIYNRTSVMNEDFDMNELDVRDGSTQPLVEDADEIIHPDWFRHDVPLFMMPVYEEVYQWADAEDLSDPLAFTQKMSSYRGLLSAVRGRLEAKVDLVTTMQTKMAGLLVAGLMWLYTTWKLKRCSKAS